MSDKEPFVSVVTPVYNGGEYFSQCIDSVVSQKYCNWEYIIVNNCSTDGSLQIAQNYAQKDDRIRIIDNESFVDVITNHNNAFRAISAESSYCKVVSADDWIYPDCLAAMVAIADRHPSIGIVGSYNTTGEGVQRVHLPLDTTFVSGREAGRRQLLGAAIFKPPSALLYRSDMVRASESFFPGAAPSADMDAFFRDMENYDFGCVHQVLSFERVHPGAITSTLRRFNSLLVDRLEFLVRYGSNYLTQEEYENRLAALMEEYYEFLADRAIHFADKGFWIYQSRRLEPLGYQIDKVRLSAAVLKKSADLLLNPKQSLEKILRRL